MPSKILMCHPRCGSNWFLSGLVGTPYTHDEVFGPLYPAYRSVPVKTLLAGLDRANMFFKVHFLDIDKNQDSARREQIIEGLQSRELYFLERKSVKDSIVSFAIAYKNNNFLEKHDSLNKTFKLSEREVIAYYDLLYGSIDRLKSQFSFKQEFVYEDLLDGINTPKYFDWSASNSKTVRRNSISRVDLIENWDKVQHWISSLPAR